MVAHAEIQNSARGAGPHLVLWLLVALFAGFIVWASFGRLDVVATAYGNVVPSSQIKSIAHLEGGIVREILVHEGEFVSAGQALVALDPVRSDADVQTLEGRLVNLRVEIARLEAESALLDEFSVDEGLVLSNAELVAQARQLFQSRRDRVSNMLASQDERIAQRKNEIESIRQRIQSNRTRLKLVREQIAISEGLMADQLSNRMNHLNLLKESAALDARVAEDTQALPRAEAALNESTAEREGILAEFVQNAQEQLAARRAEVQEEETKLLKYKDARNRTVLRSPVDGVVKSLNISTVGGVVRPGETVLDVVPGSDKLIIEAKLPTQDIGYVRSGQEVQVTLASPDASRFGRIKGRVVNVSPDTIETGEGIPYYKVRIETDQSHFRSDAVIYDLYPGVQVSCAIRTGQRSVMAYLLDPFLTSAQTALRER
jgi:adhesin transport system membrane fusion protein